MNQRNLLLNGLAIILLQVSCLDIADAAPPVINGNVITWSCGANDSTTLVQEQCTLVASSWRALAVLDTGGPTVTSYHGPVGPFDTSISEEYPEGTTQICSGWMFDANSNGHVDTGDSMQLAGSSCTPVQPLVSCTSTNVDINHGSLAPNEYDGNIAHGNGTITCTGGDATVNLSFSPSTINLSNGTKSALLFTESNRSSYTLGLSEGESSSFTVSSTLSGTPAIGDFSGSTVLTLTVN